MTSISNLILDQFHDHIANPSPVWAGGTVLAMTSACLSPRRNSRGPRASARTSPGPQFECFLLKTPKPITEIPIAIARDAWEGWAITHHSLLRAYHPAQLDFECARALFATVLMKRRAIAEENLSTLTGEAKDWAIAQLAEIPLGPRRDSFTIPLGAPPPPPENVSRPVIPADGPRRANPTASPGLDCA